MKTILLFILASLSIAPLSAQIYVDAAASGTSDGSSWVNARTDLQGAIYNAVAGDTIWVREGTYYPSIDTNGVFPPMPEVRSFWLKNNVVVYGGFNGTETSLSQRDPINLKATLEGHIDTSWVEHVLYIYSAIDSSAVLDGFIVQNGKSSVTSAGKSGAGMLLKGDARFFNLLFRDNTAYNHGGAVYGEMSNALFVSCRFTNNGTVQYDGAAANLVYSDVSMYNCVIDNNHATRFGGAITTVESDLLVQNGTFAANSAGSNIFQFSTSGTIDLYNCIFTADNTAPAILGTSGGAATFRECLMPITSDWMLLCPACFSGAPSFTNAAAGDFSLMAGSEGIDETLTVTPVNNYDDIAGNPRLVGASMDLGAYENEGSVGLPAPSTAQHLTAWPNPASSYLTIGTTETIQNISIFNSAGMLVQSETSNTFSVEHLPAGIYFLEIITEKGVSRGRFIKA